MSGLVMIGTVLLAGYALFLAYAVERLKGYRNFWHDALFATYGLVLVFALGIGIYVAIMSIVES